MPPRRKRPWVEWRGKKCRVRWPDPTGEIRSQGGFEDEAEALRYGYEQMGQITRGEWRDPRKGEVTLTEWVNLWWQGRDLGPNTTKNYRWYIEALILPTFGHRELAELTTPEIDMWERGIEASGYVRSTASDTRSRLITILGDAVTAGLIGTNPAARARRRGRRSGRRRGRRAKAWATPLEVLLVAERTALISGRDEDMVMVITLGWTGMRLGEVVGMQREYFHQTHYQLDWQLLGVPHFHLGPPKDDSYRTLDEEAPSRVDLPPFLGDLITRVIRSHPGCCRCPGAPPQCGGQGYIFLGSNGGHLRGSNYARRLWRPACDGMYPAENSKSRPARPVLVDANCWPGTPQQPWPIAEPGKPFEPPRAGQSKGRKKLPANMQLASWLPVKRGLVPHGLRHGHRTWMDEDDIPEILKSERLGHVVPGMRGVYSHVSDVMRKTLVDTLERRWEHALAERALITPRSPVPLLDELLSGAMETLVRLQQPTWNPARVAAEVERIRESTAA